MLQDEDDPDPGPSLKDMVTATLQAKGVLGKIQAQLRASVFLTLEEEFKEKNLPLVNAKSKDLLSSPVGKLAAAIIKDFLECLDLEFTMAVFAPESNLASVEEPSEMRALLNNFIPHNKRLKDVPDGKCPALFQLIEELQQFRQDHSMKGIITGAQPGKSSADSSHINESDPTGTSLEDPMLLISNAEVNDCKLLKEDYTDGDDVEKESISDHITQKSDATSLVSHQNVSSDSENSSKTLENEDSDSISVGESKTEDKEAESVTSKSKSKSYKEEEDMASLSGVKELPGDEREAPVINRTTADDVAKNTSEDGSVEVAEEDIDEDIDVDDILSSASELSNQTKDASESKAMDVADYQESL